MLRWLALAILLAHAAVSPAPAGAQTRLSPPAASDTPAIQEIFQLGQQLESERRWDEALSHYERALRQHPGRGDLEDRVVLARFHYDVARRYHDASFLETTRTISLRDAQDLYGEVLLKIHAHYVDQPDWNRLLQRGLTGAEVALTEPVFLQRYQVGAPLTAQATLSHLRQQFTMHPALTRHDARQRAGDAARLLHQGSRIPEQALLLEFVCAAVSALDDYSAFLSGNQLDDVLSQIEGNFVGLGIELKAEDSALLIVSVIPDGPADAVGMRPHDRIIEIDGHSTRDISTDTAADLLKGLEGSRVELVVASPGREPRRLLLDRRRVEVPSVEHTAILDPDYGVGYLRLVSFQKTTSRDVDAALWKLHREGMRSLIIDVRSNPGGLLTASVEVADKFVAQGPIVATRGRSSGEDFDYKAHAVGTWQVPLVVLIDGDSASASEIFAGAIRDHRRGTLVGSRSYGKGSVQGIFPLTVVNAGVRLTTAKFYSPSGRPISRQGVQPDIVVEALPHQFVARPINGELPVLNEQDPVLNAGLQAARQQVAQR